MSYYGEGDGQESHLFLVHGKKTNGLDVYLHIGPDSEGDPNKPQIFPLAPNLITLQKISNDPRAPELHAPKHKQDPSINEILEQCIQEGRRGMKRKYPIQFHDVNKLKGMFFTSGTPEYRDKNGYEHKHGKYYYIFRPQTPGATYNTNEIRISSFEPFESEDIHRVFSPVIALSHCLLIQQLESLAKTKHSLKEWLKRVGYDSPESLTRLIDRYAQETNQDKHSLKQAYIEQISEIMTRIVMKRGIFDEEQETIKKKIQYFVEQNQ